MKQDKSHLPLVPYVIGLTGGSGSGKSSIARQLEALGAVRINSDQLGHETYRPGEVAYNRVLEEFGSGASGSSVHIADRSCRNILYSGELI